MRYRVGADPPRRLGLSDPSTANLLPHHFRPGPISRFDSWLRQSWWHRSLLLDLGGDFRLALCVTFLLRLLNHLVLQLEPEVEDGRIAEEFVQVNCKLLIGGVS